MPNYCHRLTFQQLRSIASADLPEPENNYVLDPDYSGVVGEPVKYWVLSGDIFSLVDQTARDAIDAAEDSDQLDAISDELTQTRTILQAFAEVVLDEINSLRTQHGLPARTLGQLKTAVRSKL